MSHIGYAFVSNIGRAPSLLNCPAGAFPGVEVQVGGLPSERFIGSIGRWRCEDGPRCSLYAKPSSRPLLPIAPAPLPAKASTAPNTIAKGSFRQVIRYCGALQRLETRPADVTEPEWTAAASIAVRCDDGRQAFHELSALDTRRYNASDTDRKLDHVEASMKPRTCEAMESEACYTCPFRAMELSSPVALAHGDPKLLPIQSRTVLVTGTSQYHSLDGRPAEGERSFTNRTASLVSGNPHSAFIRDGRSPKVDKTDYLPGTRSLIVKDHATKVLNLWKPGGVKADEGDCSTLLNHFALLLPNKDDRNHVLSYLAWAVQHPADKMAHAILLIGGQGVGKSTLNKVLCGLFGEQNLFVDTAGIHASRFRSQMGNRQVAVIEELNVGSRFEVYNDLKPWITEDMVMAEEKHVAAQNVRTPRGMLVYSNHNVPISLEEGDRRFAIYRIDAQPREHSYYERLHEACQTEIAAFKHYLAEYDTSKWSPHAAPPVSQAKLDLIADSRTQLASAVEGILADHPDRDLWTAEELVVLVSRSEPSLTSVTANTIARALNELKARSAGRQRLTDGKRVRLWIVRNEMRWLEATLEQKRAHFEFRPSIDVNILLDRARNPANMALQ